MGFYSILYESAGHAPEPVSHAPAVFTDLNLSPVIDAITAKYEEYELKPFYYTCLRDLETISYRQEIMKDLDHTTAMEAVRAFTEKMHLMRAFLDQSKRFELYRHAMTRRFLAAVELYCDGVTAFAHDLSACDLKSRGLRAFREYLSEYLASAAFCRLVEAAKTLTHDLSTIRYSLVLGAGTVSVQHESTEADYSTSVEDTFAKFREGAAGKHWVEIPQWSGMNHIEAQIQDRVALLYPEVFGSLNAFYAEHSNYLDPTVGRFDREVQFYIAYLTYIQKFREAGLDFCLPILSKTSKEVSAQNAFDIALGDKLIHEKRAVVRNDFSLSGSERILVVSGPNQGGKTTLARMFGQMHHLGALGCLVQGTAAHLFAFDQMFAHFERSEDPMNLRGKLQDDLVRIRRILEDATPNSIVILNEIFSSTTIKDALFLSTKIIEKMSALDLIGVCVTFLDELALLNEKTVSMVSCVDPLDPAIRTFKVERRPPDGLAYALAIAEKYHVTYNWIMDRVQT